MVAETLFNKRHHPTIRKILDASHQEFSQSGFSGARMDHIAEKAQVNKAAIYYHVGDKETLYQVVIQEVVFNVQETVAGIAQAPGNPEEKIRNLVKNFDRVLRENPNFPRIMLREILDGGSLLSEEILGYMTSVLGNIHSILGEGRAQGLFRQIHPLPLHLTLVGSIIFYRLSAAMRKRFQNQSFDRKVTEIDDRLYLEQITEIITQALKK